MINLSNQGLTISRKVNDDIQKSKSKGRFLMDFEIKGYQEILAQL